MYYWKEYMNWPLKEGWVCEICGQNAGLVWGLIHGECRCNICHTEYSMRDKENKITNIPICIIKPEYRQAWIKIWNNSHKTLEEITDSEWDNVLKEINNEKT